MQGRAGQVRIHAVRVSGDVTVLSPEDRQLQSALRRLDFVSREEFDAQRAILERTRARVMALEGELAALNEQLEQLERS